SVRGVSIGRRTPSRQHLPNHALGDKYPCVPHNFLRGAARAVWHRTPASRSAAPELALWINRGIYLGTIRTEYGQIRHIGWRVSECQQVYAIAEGSNGILRR